MRVAPPAFIHRLTSNRLIRSLAAMSGSTGIASLVGLLVAPFLTRLYSPDDFGVFSYIIAIVAVLSVLAGLRLELAAPLPESDVEGGLLIRLALAAATVFSLVLCGGIAAGGAYLDDQSNLSLLPWLWFLPPLVWLTASYVILSQAAIRKRDYNAVATRTLVQSVSTSIGQLALAAVLRSPGGLLVGQLFGRCMGILSLARRNRDLLVSREPLSGARAMLREYWRFPAVFTPSALLNTLGTQLPLLLVGAWYGVEAAGFLGVTQRVLEIPSVLVGAALGQVLMGELSARHRVGERDNRRVYARTSVRLALGGAGITLATLFLAPWVFPLVLGQQWAEAGSYAQAMAISVGVGFVASPLSQVFFLHQKGGAAFALDVFRVAVVGGLGFVAHSMQMEATGAIWLMYLGQAVTYALTWWLGWRIVRGQNEGYVQRDG